MMLLVWSFLTFITGFRKVYVAKHQCRCPFWHNFELFWFQRNLVSQYNLSFLDYSITYSGLFWLGMNASELSVGLNLLICYSCYEIELTRQLPILHNLITTPVVGIKISSEEILPRLVLPVSDFQGCQVFELSYSFGHASYFLLCLFRIPPNAFISCGGCNFYANCRLNQSCCSLDFWFYQIN